MSVLPSQLEREDPEILATLLELVVPAQPETPAQRVTDEPDFDAMSLEEIDRYLESR